MKTWYQMTAEEALRGMESSHGGLSSGQAEVRCGQFGENVLQEHAGKKNLAGISGAVSGSSGVDPDRGSGNFCSFWQWGECGCYFCGDHHECGIGNDSA